VAARSKTQVCGRSPAEIVGSNSLLEAVEREACAVKQCQPACSECKEVTVRSVVYHTVSVSAEKRSRNNGIMSERQNTVVCSFEPKSPEFQLLTFMNGFSNNCTWRKM